jgi:hypothetical protein
MWEVPYMSEIKVNRAQWDAVAAGDQRKIVEGLKTAGALKPADVVIADSGVPAFTRDTVMQPMWNPIKDLCKAGCDVAAAAAFAWCTANTAGVGLAACMAVANGAREACHRACE